MPRVKKENKETPVAKIYDNGRLIREYSVEEHGNEYLILAEQFANKKNFTIKYDNSL